MSVTKPMTALCLQILVDRGQLDVFAPIAAYWPEFAAAGKSEITVADVLTHVSGVVGSAEISALVDLDRGTGVDRVPEMTALLAAAEPVWAPRTAAGYHTLTYGTLLAEVLRRIDGRGLDEFFYDEVAGPLGLPGLRIGTPVDEHHTIAAVLPVYYPPGMPPEAVTYVDSFLGNARQSDTPAGISCFARDGVGALDRLPELFNNRPGRVTPMGGSNMCGTARDVAKAFAAVGDPEGFDGVPLSSPETTALFTEIREERPDLVTLLPTSRGLGWWRNIALPGRPPAFGPNPEAFGHTGIGGQNAFADPKARVGAAFVRNHYTVFPVLPILLHTALYQAIA
jgi:CubicO group peptidase (beta-lactamase class C family)